jgi:hypothetical protein
MRKAIAILTILLISATNLLAENPQELNERKKKVLPVIALPAKPTKQVMANRNVYFSTILEYYEATIAYKAQLELLGKAPNIKIIAPTFSQFSKPNQKFVQNQWRQAENLYNQIRNTDVLVANEKDENLREQLNYVKSERIKIQNELEKCKLELQEKEFYEKHYENFYNSAMKNLDFLQNQLTNNTIPTLGIGIGGTTFLYHDEKFTSEAALNFSIYLNPAQLLGIDFLDFWFDYSNSAFKIKTDDEYYYYPQATEYKDYTFSAGVNLNLPLSKLLDFEKYYWGIKAGAGYYWKDVSLPNAVDILNAGSSEINWNGAVIRLETELANFATSFPFGIYASYSFMKTNKELNLYGYNNDINLNDKWIGSVNVGLRFFLTGFSPLKP